jgi:hypothetical protein
VILVHWPREPECGRPRQTGRQVVTVLGYGVKGGADPNCKGATEEIDATIAPNAKIADGPECPRVAQMASVSMSVIVPLLGDNRTQRGHHQIDVNDPKQTFASSVVPEGERVRGSDDADRR